MWRKMSIMGLLLLAVHRFLLPLARLVVALEGLVGLAR